MTFPASNINYSAQEDLYLAVISGPISIFIILLTIFWYNFWIQWTIWPHNSIHASAGMHWLVWRIRSTAFFPEQIGNSCFSSDKCRPKKKFKFYPASSVWILRLLKDKGFQWRYLPRVQTKVISMANYPKSSAFHSWNRLIWICLCRLLIHSEYLLKKSWKEI